MTNPASNSTFENPARKAVAALRQERWDQKGSDLVSAAEAAGFRIDPSRSGDRRAWLFLDARGQRWWLPVDLDGERVPPDHVIAVVQQIEAALDFDQ